MESGHEHATRCLVALGGNLPGPAGDAAATVRVALGLLDRPDHRVMRVSRLFATPAHPPGSGPDYVNAAAVIRSALEPAALLARLHGIERRLGRRRHLRWGARVIDLDLLACGDRVLPDASTVRRWMELPAARQVRDCPDRLILPHPRLQDRAFVLVPLAEVAPDWRHPLTGLSVSAMLAALPAAQRAAIRPLDRGAAGPEPARSAGPQPPDA